MKTSKYITGLLMAIMMSVVSSCFDDLDQYPHIEQTPKDIYTSVPNYRQVLAKLYGSYVLAGQDKGGGNTDISGSRGFDYMRCYFNLQEIGTDETAMLSYASDNQTGPAEIIEDGKTGFLIPPFDLEQMEEKIELLIQKDALRKKFAQQAEKSRQKFALDKIVAQWERLLEEII